MMPKFERTITQTRQVEAIRFTGENCSEVWRFIEDDEGCLEVLLQLMNAKINEPPICIYPGAWQKAKPGEWVVRDRACYILDNETFEKTFSKVKEPKEMRDEEDSTTGVSE